MDWDKTCFIFIIVGLFLATGTEGQRCKTCGTRGRCCLSDEVCEANVDGGTCYKEANRVTCNSFYYCYKPTTCCGFGSCCPANSQCCGLNTCCPENSECCMSQCCGEGTKCNGAYCESKGSYSYSGYTFSWYYILFIILPIVAVCGALGRRMRYRRAMTQAHTGRVILRNDYAAESSPAAPTTIDAATFAPPPAYNDIVTNQGACPGYEDVNKDKFPEPPPYSEVVSQPSAPGMEEQQQPFASGTDETTGTINQGYSTEPDNNKPATV